MNITRRDFAWLAIGLVVGGVVTVLFTTISTRPPAASYVAAGPILTEASARVLVVTNFRWNLKPIRIDLPSRFPEPYPTLSPMYSLPQRSLDLIDTRPQPEIKLDEMR
jgi:hypothetical protein